MPVSGKRMAKVLEARGWVLRRVRGSHHIYKHPDNPIPANVPIHGNRDLGKIGAVINRPAGYRHYVMKWHVRGSGNVNKKPHRVRVRPIRNSEAGARGEMLAIRRRSQRHHRVNAIGPLRGIYR